jgi:hypothetical protein
MQGKESFHDNENMSEFLLSILLNAVVVYSIAAVLSPLYCLRKTWAFRASNCVAFAIALFPLLMPESEVVQRALVAVLSTEVALKIADFTRQNWFGKSQLRWKDFLGMLVRFPALLVVFEQRRRKLGVPVKSRDVLGGIVGLFLLAGVTLAMQMISGHTTFDNSAFQSSFLLDHSAKFFLFAITLEALARILLMLERLASYQIAPIVQNAYLSRTVSQFWNRYNTRVNRWFYKNMFRLSGTHSPVRGVFLVFFVSALHHELLFGIATSRFDGYQFAFFMLQAPAAILSPWLLRFGNKHWSCRLIAHGLTITWFYWTSMLFFHGANRVFPFFYTSTPWLP